MSRRSGFPVTIYRIPCYLKIYQNFLNFKNFFLILDCLKTILIPWNFQHFVKIPCCPEKNSLISRKTSWFSKIFRCLKNFLNSRKFLKYFKNFRLGQVMMGEPIYTILYYVFSTLSPFLKSLTISRWIK